MSLFACFSPSTATAPIHRAASDPGRTSPPFSGHFRRASQSMLLGMRSVGDAGRASFSALRQTWQARFRRAASAPAARPAAFASPPMATPESLRAQYREAGFAMLEDKAGQLERLYAERGSLPAADAANTRAWRALTTALHACGSPEAKALLATPLGGIPLQQWGDGRHRQLDGQSLDRALSVGKEVCQALQAVSGVLQAEGRRQAGAAADALGGLYASRGRLPDGRAAWADLQTGLKRMGGAEADALLQRTPGGLRPAQWAEGGAAGLSLERALAVRDEVLQFLQAVPGQRADIRP